MKWENDTFALILRMRQMVYSSKDFNLVDFCRDSTKHASVMVFAAPKVESLWILRPVGSKLAELERLYQTEGLPKNISIEEFFDERSGKPIIAKSTESTFRLSKNGIRRRIRRFILLQ